MVIVIKTSKQYGCFFPERGYLGSRCMAKPHLPPISTKGEMPGLKKAVGALRIG